MGMENPCIQCGACCAFFRVSFYWEEVSDPDGVPAGLTEKADDLFQCMKGTNQPVPRCVALKGTIGEKVGCAIYSRRSSTCQEFGLQCHEGQLAVDGINLVRCNQARRAWNLPPLTRAELRRFSHYLPVRPAPVATLSQHVHRHHH